MSNAQDNAAHTCSYSCDRPECIKAQRDELAAAAAQEAVAEVIDINGRSGVEIHWLAGPVKIGDLLYAAPVTAAPVGVTRAVADEAPFGLNATERAAWARGFNDALEAASTPAAPGIDLSPFRRLVEWNYESESSAYENGFRTEDQREVAETERKHLLALIDASPKGGSEARDAALNTLAIMFHNSEEIEGPDGMAVSIDLALWHEALEAYEVLIGDYDEVTLATSAQAQAGDAEVQP